MKYSYNWLQEYFEEKLPHPEELKTIISMHAFEVEEVVSYQDDYILDVKVLPDRARDVYSVEGMAREICSITGLRLVQNFRDMQKSFSLLGKNDDSLNFNLVVTESDLVNRAMKWTVSNVKIGPSPEWLVKKLNALGQKSINTVVDITNYVMFETGQPIHAFDYDKLSNDKTITIRRAKIGEKVETLDGKVFDLTESMLVLADADGPLDVAGVKGGIRSGISESTNRIVFSACTFDPASIRKTSQVLNLKTDASRRFEQDLSSELPQYALRRAVYWLSQISNDIEPASEPIDLYERKVEDETVSVSLARIQSFLGFPILESDVQGVFDRSGFISAYDGESFLVTVPKELYRKDILINEDLIEEAGRVFGYEHVPPMLPAAPSAPVIPHKDFYYKEKIRDILVNLGLSEIYTYSFVEKGEVKLLNFLTEDKSSVRDNLHQSMRSALELNARNSELLALPLIKVFEFSKVFFRDSEKENLCIGISLGAIRGKKENTHEILLAIIAMLEKELGVKMIYSYGPDSGVAEIDFEELLKHLPDVVTPLTYTFGTTLGREIGYKPVSTYPFVIRDIAVWTTEASQNDVLKIITKNAGNYLVQTRFFDSFTKEDKTSYAFTLIFQSHSETLTDEVVNKMMENVTDALNAQSGWAVR